MEESNIAIICIFSFLIFISIGFVSGVIEVRAPLNYTNFTSSATFNVSYTNGTDIVDASNATFYYNLSGTWTVIGNVTCSGNGASMSSCSSTLSTALLTDGIYSIKAILSNGTNVTNISDSSTVTNNIIFDNTPPAVTTFYNTLDNGNYSSTNLFILNVSVSDATIGMLNGSVYFNITNVTGTQINFTLATTFRGEYYNATINSTTFPADGRYNVTVWANDTLLNLNNTEGISFVLDNVIPNHTKINNPVSRGNYSGILVLNVTAKDANTSISSVFLNITNSSGQQENFTVASSFGSDYYILNLTTSVFTDGLYNITAYVNDTAGNLNNTGEVVEVTFDNTAPTGSMSCTPTNVQVGDTVTCSCGSSDSGGSGVNLVDISFTANPPTVNTGTFTESCSFSDLAGNTGSVSTSYTVEMTSSGTSSGGGGSLSADKYYSKTIPMTGTPFEELKTITQKLKNKERIKIIIGGEGHFIGVRELTLTTATVEIGSEPVQIILDVGEDAKMDVDDDDFYEVYVKLVSIINGQADLRIEYLHEAVPVTEDGEEGSSVETSGDIVEPPEEVEEEGDLNWLWVLIGFISVIIVGVVIYIFVKKK